MHFLVPNRNFNDEFNVFSNFLSNFANCTQIAPFTQLHRIAPFCDYHIFRRFLSF